METIITIKDLRKVYKLGSEKVVALDNINLEIQKGQVCCILGTSGSGKSTLLNQLAGLEKPTRGAVYIGKNNISKFGEDRLAAFRQRNIGFIFQSYNLMTSHTALENVAMPLMFRGVPKAKREKIAAQMLREVGLEKRMHHRPNQMSGGQQQRVGIARAFVASPKIIFADEPTGNLDTKTTIEVMAMMVRMCRQNNQTLILVTHDSYLAQYADRIVTLIDGKIVSDVENKSIVDRMSNEEIVEYFLSENANLAETTVLESEEEIEAIRQELQEEKQAEGESRRWGGENLHRKRNCQSRRARLTPQKKIWRETNNDKKDLCAGDHPASGRADDPGRDGSGLYLVCGGWSNCKQQQSSNCNFEWNS
ncbi:MAG: ABC transporter ATP-binding protein [Acutalibacteraceae bacterium]